MSSDLAENEVDPLPKVEFVFKTKGDAGWDLWQVVEFRVRERISTPYHGSIDIVAPGPGMDVSKLLGKSCNLVLSRGRDHRRFFKGIVYSVERDVDRPTNSVFRVNFAAALYALQHGKDSRIFENRTVPQIVEEVIKEGLTPFDRKVRLNLTRSYRNREYCTQLNESDWDFVQRLIINSGISFYFNQGEDEEGTETIVLVDSNYSFPRIRTMARPAAREKPEPPPPLQASSWVEVQVVWDGSGEPVANLPLVVEPPGGRGSMRSTGRDGRVRLDPADPGACEARCDLTGLKYGECVEVAGMGEKPAAANGGQHEARASEPSRGDRAQAIVRVVHRKVRSGDTLESIAKEEGLEWQELAFFNFGTKDAEEVNQHLIADVGCTQRTADGQSYLFADGDSPGVILAPRPWRQSGLASGRVHVIRVRPAGLTGVFHLRHHFEPEAVAEQEHRLSSADGSHEQTTTAADGARPDDDTGTADLSFAGCPAHLSYSLDIADADSASTCFEELSYQGSPDGAEEGDQGGERAANEGDSGDPLLDAEPPEAA